MTCGEIFNKHFAANLLQNLTVKQFENLLRINRVTVMSVASSFLEHSKWSIAVRRRLTATGTHVTVPYGITQYYLLPGSGDIPVFTPAEAGTRSSDPGGMQG